MTLQVLEERTIDPPNIQPMLEYCNLPHPQSLPIEIKDIFTMRNPIIESTNRLQQLIHEERDSQLASGYHKRLIKWINEFHKSLGDEYEAGACLVNFGQRVTFHIEDIGYWNPALISFIGTAEDGTPVELIQHVNQLSVLLMKLKRREPEAPKRPIGFMSWEDYQAATEESPQA